MGVEKSWCISMSVADTFGEPGPESSLFRKGFAREKPGRPLQSPPLSGIHLRCTHPHIPRSDFYHLNEIHVRTRRVINLSLGYKFWIS